MFARDQAQGILIYQFEIVPDRKALNTLLLLYGQLFASRLDESGRRPDE